MQGNVSAFVYELPEKLALISSPEMLKYRTSRWLVSNNYNNGKKLICRL